MSQSKNKKKIIVLGAGMAGLGAGVQLQRLGFDSLILEKENYIGGLYSNNELLGCDFDYGPKILFDNERSKEIVEMMGDNIERYPVIESVYLTKYGFMNYPLQRHLNEFPEEIRNKVLKEITTETEKPTIENFEDWLRYNYGEYFTNEILIPYETKKWLTDLKEMDYKWALERAYKVTKEEIIKGSQEHLGPNRWYFYPKTGNITEVVNAIVPHAGPILTNHEVTKIDLQNKYLIAGGKKFYYDAIVSTIPADITTKISTPVKNDIKLTSESNLKRLSIAVLNMAFEGNHDLHGTAIYFPEKEFIFRRVSVLEKLCPALSRKGKTPITVEISINEELTEKKQKALFKEVMKGFSKIEQFAKLGKPLAHEFLKIDFAYPLQTNELKFAVSEIQNYFEEFDVFSAGRGGTFNYCDADLAYEQGKHAADKISEALFETADVKYWTMEVPATVTIGIPVHNEQENIQNLLESILRQKSKHYTLKKVVVLGDACTDNTQKIVEKIAKKEKLIQPLFDDERHGKQVRLNQLFKMNESDIIVCFDGDVVIKDEDTLHKLITAFNSKEVGLVAGRDIPIPGKTFIEKITNTMELMWYNTRKDVRNGIHSHNSRGRFFAVSKEFGKKIYFPHNVLDDNYIYLWGIKNGYKFGYEDEAKIYYSTPSNFRDYLLQSSRFSKSPLISNIYNYFDDDFVNSHRHIPYKSKIMGIIKTFVNRPILTILSLVYTLYVRKFPQKDILHDKGIWETASSTKKSIDLKGLL